MTTDQPAEPQYTLYTSSTCSRCPLARTSLANSGVAWVEYVLDEPANAELLEELRKSFSRDGARMEVPILEGPDRELYTNLATISGHLRSVRISS